MTDTAPAPAPVAPAVPAADAAAPAAPAAPATTVSAYEFEVAMSCSGCSGAVERALKKVEAIESFDVNLKEQRVRVTTALTKDAILEIIKKTGKAVKPIASKTEEAEETEKAAA
ncbi:Cytosolic copper metallochaperone [Coemansia sp. RSA 2599]|nr:Cytosolic copper metallochaperone [Coemansia sp. RSA 2599]